MEVLASLITSSLDTLLTGVDSIWLKDPFEAIESRNEDIVAMGLGSSVLNWSLNVSNDFLFVRSSSTLIPHLSRLLELSKRLVNDQSAMNMLLSEMGIEWSEGDGKSWRGITQKTLITVYLFPLSFGARDPKMLTPETSILQPPSAYLGRMKVIRELEKNYLLT